MKTEDLSLKKIQKHIYKKKIGSKSVKLGLSSVTELARDMKHYGVPER